MQFLNDVKQKGVKLLTENASVLLTAGGVIGTVGTAVLAGRAGIKAHTIIQGMNDEPRVRLRSDEEGGGEEIVPYTKVEKALKVGPHFIPPVLLGGFTIASIVMANRVSAQKLAAMAAAYGLAERNLSEYKEKVAEKLTGPKKDAIDTEIAQDRVNRTPGHEKVIIIEGSDDVLCLDESTGRYFKSNPEKIRRAVNSTNAEILRHGGASVSHFYDELELPPTSFSDTIGWGVGEQIEIKYSYVQAPDERPVLAIDFATVPHLKYDEPYS